MINWLKYAPFEFRTGLQDDEYLVPDIKKAQNIVCNYRGCGVSIKVPRHRIDGTKAKVSPRLSDYEGVQFSRSGIGGPWDFVSISFREIAIRSAWFGGEAGRLYFSHTIHRRQRDKEFNGISFFHPRVFESALVNYLCHQRQKSIVVGGDEYYQVPYNWAVIDSQPVVIATFEQFRARERFVVFPVSPSEISVMSFSYSARTPEVEKDINHLIDEIIKTIKVELSPEHQAEIDKLKKNGVTMTLPKEFPPLKFPIDVEELESNQGLNVAEPKQEESLFLTT